MKFFKNKINIIGLIMFIIMIICAILLRINNNVTKIIGILLFPIVVILGIILLKVDKR